MHGLVQIGDPMAEPLQRTELVIFIRREGKTCHVFKDC
jgi:hypothetical protein